jgi:hypothetical protein
MRDSGTTVYDEIGANNGTAAGGVTFATTYAAVGHGARFDGTNDMITIASTQVIPATGSFTLSLWIETTSLASIQTVLSAGTYLVDELILFGSVTAGSAVNQLRLFNRADGEILVGSDIRSTGWRHIALTRNGTTYTLYLDGASNASATKAGAIGAGLNIGAAPFESGGYRYFYSGNIDEVRIYNVALTADEVKQLYRMGAIPKGIK